MVFQRGRRLLAQRFGGRLTLTACTAAWAVLTVVTGLVPGAAAGAGPDPAAERWAVRPLAEVDLAVTEALDRSSLAAEDEMRDREGLPWRFALPADVTAYDSSGGMGITTKSAASMAVQLH